MSKFTNKVADDLVPTRATLLHRLKDWRDQPSWQDFFDTYWKLIYSMAMKSGLDESEARDVVQETMLSVAKQMPGFEYDRSTGSFKTWLLNVTRWRIADQFRKRDQVPVYDASDNVVAGVWMTDTMLDPTSHSLEALWNAEWEKNLLDAAMDKVRRRLDPHTYQIFDFLVNKEWSPEKTAKAFGISLSQVYLAKHRGSEMIAEEVKRLEKKMG